MTERFEEEEIEEYCKPGVEAEDCYSCGADSSELRWNKDHCAYQCEQCGTYQ